MDSVEPAQLLDRALVVVDAEVDDEVGEPGVAAVALDDEQRGGLLAAPVAARSLRGGEALDQALGQRAGRRLERLRERVDGLSGDEDVPLRRVAGAGAAAGPVVAARAGEARAAPCRVDDSELAALALVVGLGQPAHDLVGGQSLAQEREPVRAVAGVGVRLGRDGADLRLGPGNDRPDREELRLHRDAPLARVEVAGDDRVGADRRRERWFVLLNTSSPIGQLGQVEREQLLGRHEHRGHLGPGERRLHALGRVRPDDDGRPCLVRGPQRVEIGDVVEHERVSHVERALERELGHPPTRSADTSALSQLDRPTRLRRLDRHVEPKLRRLLSQLSQGCR